MSDLDDLDLALVGTGFPFKKLRCPARLPRDVVPQSSDLPLASGVADRPHSICATWRAADWRRSGSTG